MKKSLVVLALALAGCDGSTYEASEPTSEPGKVSKLIYVPSGHGSDTAVGFTSSGDLHVTPINVKIPARYGIVFECQHGTFAIEGDKWKPLWASLKEGQQVDIQYRTIYRVQTGKAEKERSFHKLDFLGASPKGDR